MEINNNVIRELINESSTFKIFRKEKESTITKLFQSSQSEINTLTSKTIKDIKGVSWKVKLIGNPNVKKESGSTPQQKLKLISELGYTKEARVKEIETLNEALVYHQIKSNKNNQLHQFMPEFITILDKNGNPIDIEKELAKCDNSIKKLCKKEEFRPAYLIIRDLVDEIEEKKDKSVTKEEIKDLKFIKPSLQGSNAELRLHGYKPANFAFNVVRRVFFSLSGCSFAFQEQTKSKWYTIILNNIKRIMTLRSTKQVIRSEFERLPKEELRIVRSKLQEIREAVKNSDHAFADASFLFIPLVKIVDGKQVQGLEVRLIDMGHTTSEREIEKERERLQSKSIRLDVSDKKQEKYLKRLTELDEAFATAKEEMEESIKELENMLDSIINQNEGFEPS